MSPDPVLSRRILVLIISTFLHFKHAQIGLIHHTIQPFLRATVDYEIQLSLLFSLILVRPRDSFIYVCVCDVTWCLCGVFYTKMGSLLDPLHHKIGQIIINF